MSDSPKESHGFCQVMLEYWCIYFIFKVLLRGHSFTQKGGVWHGPNNDIIWLVTKENESSMIAGGTPSPDATVIDAGGITEKFKKLSVNEKLVVNYGCHGCL